MILEVAVRILARREILPVKVEDRIDIGDAEPCMRHPVLACGRSHERELQLRPRGSRANNIVILRPHANAARLTTTPTRNHLLNDPQLDSFIWPHPFPLNSYYGDAAVLTRHSATCQQRNINFTFRRAELISPFQLDSPVLTWDFASG
jgi:hypothetical protein